MPLPATADLIGWTAAVLMIATFGCREGMRMRGLAVSTNLAFIAYAWVAGLSPVLALHAILLPINLWRLYDAWRGRRTPQRPRRRGPRREPPGTPPSAPRASARVIQWPSHARELRARSGDLGDAEAPARNRAGTAAG